MTKKILLYKQVKISKQFYDFYSYTIIFFIFFLLKFKRFLMKISNTIAWTAKFQYFLDFKFLNKTIVFELFLNILERREENKKSDYINKNYIRAQQLIFNIFNKSKNFKSSLKKTKN